MDESLPLTIDLEDLGLDRGAHLLIARALNRVETGEPVRVIGRDPNLALHLRTWARANGHTVDGDVVTKGEAAEKRWTTAVRAGSAAVPASTARSEVGTGGARRARGSGGTPARHCRSRRSRRGVGRHRAAACTPRPPRSSGTPRQPSTGTTTTTCRPRSKTRSYKS